MVNSGWCNVCGKEIVEGPIVGGPAESQFHIICLLYYYGMELHTVPRKVRNCVKVIFISSTIGPMMTEFNNAYF